MSEMVERAARALCKADGGEWRTGTFRVRSGPNFEWEDHDADRLNNVWRYKARYAIKAMRKPSNDMLHAMHEAMFMDKFTGAELPMLNAGFEAAIDAALEGEGR